MTADVPLENLEMSERKGIIFPLQFMGNVIPPNRTTRVRQLAALVDAGEDNSHDASVCNGAEIRRKLQRAKVRGSA
jgi:hypothetical protein